MNFKQFRQSANGHNRTARVNGCVVGGRGFRLMSKIGQQAISLDRLEHLLKHANREARQHDDVSQSIESSAHCR